MADTKKAPEADANKEYIFKIKEYWDLTTSIYNREFRKLRLLDLTDRGDFWRATGAVYPKYQILPDTNHVAYVKSNILASLYSVIKSAEILPTSEEDKEITTNLNVALDVVWNTQKVGFYQFQAGERAALLNMGITQVGYDEHITIGSGAHLLKGQVRLKNIDPMKFRRDPYATSLDDSGWCCTYDDFHKSVFLSDPNYKEKFKSFENKNKDGTTLPTVPKPDGIARSAAKGYYTLLIWWIRNNDGSIDEIHTVNNEEVLFVRKNIQPSMFPFSILYCNLPAGALIGTSEPAKIFANSVAYNLMDSLALTAEYKNQRPPKFISEQSGLNVQGFAKYGDEADHTFVVTGPPKDAVYYHEFPQPSQFLTTLKQSLSFDIQNISGVDGRYTGRDTGSIITTGGTEEMLNRVTLIDTPKITLYEDYCKRLTELILKNMIHFMPKRKFFRKKPNSKEFESIEVDFPNIDNDTLFNYQINISSELPKNKQRISSMATQLLEKQYQYRQNGDSVNWITEEEWLMFQDLPFKEFMLERMGIQRRENALEQVAQVVYQYADLMKQGMSSDEAMLATADSLLKTRQGLPPETPAGPNPQLQAMVNTAEMA
jgi:uncharacterized protein YoaH (UPF0181 family)